jgi:NADH-quinone oxidoreductase subunit C
MTLDVLQSVLPGVVLKPIATADRQETIVVEADRIVEVCRTLRDSPQLGFILLSDITAADFWPREPRFEVVYHLASTTARLRLKVIVPGSSAHVPTVQSVWPAAGWLEREVWDMFGIEFDGHGDLRRLLMPEDWEGHPLRKDFPVQIRLKARSSEPLQITEEEFRANLAKDRAARSRGVEQAGH